MSKILFAEAAWEDYIYWQSQDRKTLRRINFLLKAVQREPFTGEGKPEALKRDLQGLWSRRIDECNRLVYSVSDDVITVFQCRGHYND